MGAKHCAIRVFHRQKKTSPEKKHQIDKLVHMTKIGHEHEHLFGFMVESKVKVIVVEVVKKLNQLTAFETFGNVGKLIQGEKVPAKRQARLTKELVLKLFVMKPLIQVKGYEQIH